MLALIAKAVQVAVDPAQREELKDIVKDMKADAKDAYKEHLESKEAQIAAAALAREDEEVAVAREIMSDPINHSATEIMAAREQVAAITEKQRRRAEAAQAAEEREKASVEAEFDRRAEDERRATQEAEAKARAEAKAERDASAALLQEAEAILANPLSSDEELAFARGIASRFGSGS